LHLDNIAERLHRLLVTTAETKETMSHFYINLPSNSSYEHFPNNTLTEFTTKLPSTIELTNEWEVGLAEIMFPRNWYTLPKKGLTIVVDYRECDEDWRQAMAMKLQNGEEITEDEENTIVRLKINGGFYNSMEELCEEMNQTSIRAFSETRVNIAPPTFHYKAITRRFFFTIAPGLSIYFPQPLEDILGLTSSQNPSCNKTWEKRTIKGDLSCSLQSGVHALYVYCDLLQFTHVGDIKAPLLRVVDSGGDAGDVITRYYEKPRYIPIQKKCFDTIQIIIRDDLGEKILFESGKVLLTLHFRRARNQYLI
jgi:hypothetical protein